MKNKLSVFLLLFSASIGVGAEPSVRFDQKLAQQVPSSLHFDDESGKEVEIGSYFGKPTILNLVYFGCPNLCTWVLNGLVSSMSDLSAKLGKDYTVVTVSINPHEKPNLAAAKKRSYLTRYGVTEKDNPQAAAGWHFLTGSQESIDRLADAVGFRYRYDFSSGEYAHPSGIMILGPDGRISRYFFGARFSSSELDRALKVAGSGKTGGLVDNILLLCSHYGLTSNRVGEWVLLGIRIGSLLTALALAFLIGSYIRRERST